MKAHEYLGKANSEMQNRAVTYDSLNGERSMPKTIKMFNELTGHTVSETEGWLLMAILKMVRSTQGNFKDDNYVDGSAYFALAGESAEKEKEMEVAVV